MADEFLPNPISCQSCRFRKVRCDRRKPQCGRCEEHGLACIYAQRRVRKPIVATTNDRVTFLETTLNEVFLRLDRVEEACFCRHAHYRTPEPLSVLAESDNANRGSFRARQSSVSIMDFDVGLETPALILQHALGQVQRQMERKRSSPHNPSAIFQVMPEIARTWIEGYFAHLPEDLNSAMLNMKLIRMMPDLMGMPNLHFDASLLVVYHCILYHGCFLKRQIMPARECSDYMEKIYDQCLNALASWGRVASGTLEDLNAAFFMVRVAAERFDIGLSWAMFRQASIFAKKIGLDCVDDHERAGVLQTNHDRLDAFRKCFWELISMDLYFHVFHNKPLIMKAYWDCPRVNLPWVSAAGSPGDADSVTTTRFVLDSRRTLILMEFSKLLHDATSTYDPEFGSKTMALCSDIEALYEKWSIDDMVKTMVDSGGQLWTVAGLALEGYACIFSMLRRVSAVTNEWTTSNVFNTDGLDRSHSLDSQTLNVSRRLVKAVNLLLVAFPCLSAVAVSFTVLQAHEALAHIASHLLRLTVSINDRERDTALLKDVITHLNSIAEKHEEISPLVVAWHRVIQIVEAR